MIDRHHQLLRRIWSDKLNDGVETGADAVDKLIDHDDPLRLPCFGAVVRSG